MLPFPSNVKLFIATEPADFRKSFDGLACIVEHHFGQSPQNGRVFVFLNKRATQIRLLFWDDGGFCLICKRLEVGTFRRSSQDSLDGSSIEISTAELVLLLEGIDVPATAMRRRKRYAGAKKMTARADMAPQTVM